MQYIFLLGGHDLEMLEIKKILLNQNQFVLDKQLSWGAKLSAYQEHFNNKNHFVGIELIPDCIPPAHYTEIDHHNEKSHLPSSIEQLAQLLGINLNRFQQLIAANDKGYIPAMKEMEATQEEIEHIRRLDRQAQGVSEKDEKLAEKSIDENQTQKGRLTLIHSLTPKFSAITDRLYPYEELLIYNHNQLVYYGKYAGKLANHYKELIKNQKAYSGGGPEGFFGIASGILSEDKLNNLRTDILKQIEQL